MFSLTWVINLATTTILFIESLDFSKNSVCIYNFDQWKQLPTFNSWNFIHMILTFTKFTITNSSSTCRASVIHSCLNGLVIVVNIIRLQTYVFQMHKPSTNLSTAIALEKLVARPIRARLYSVRERRCSTNLSTAIIEQSEHRILMKVRSFMPPQKSWSIGTYIITDTRKQNVLATPLHFFWDKFLIHQTKQSVVSNYNLSLFRILATLTPVYVAQIFVLPLCKAISSAGRPNVMRTALLCCERNSFVDRSTIWA